MMSGRLDGRSTVFRRVFLAGLMACLFASSPDSRASDCSDLFLLPGVHSVSERFSTFLESDSPDYETVRGLLGSMDSIDTSEEQVQVRLQPLATLLQHWATRLVAEAPTSSATTAELQAKSDKLRLLNTPALRNLLGSEKLQSQVGKAAWTYNRSLWDTTLDRTGKIAAIANAFKLPHAVAASVEVRPPLARLIRIRVVNGDVMTAPAGAVVASIECDGLCGSKINASLRPYVSKAIQGRALADGQTLTVFGNGPGSDTAKNFVLVVDDQRLPLSHIVTQALLEAEKSGFTSIVLPALRTGYAFGSVETTYEQVVAELYAGVARFSAASRGTLTDISIAVRNDGPFAGLIQNSFAASQKTRERSLREDMREVSLSGRGFILAASTSPAKVVAKDSPIYQTMLKPWDLSHMMEVHAPLRLGTITDHAAFSRAVVSVLNMPIKMPGTEYQIPEELKQFSEFIQQMIDHEAQVNPEVADFYTYITVDQHLVKKGETHRRGGIHIDGVQGARYPVKIMPEHTYSASDTVGTVFYAQPFDLRALDPSRQHVHAEIERQAKSENRVVTEDYGLYFWDSYSAHEAGTADEDVVRTFVRIEYSKKVYDGVGDTHSPLFDYSWPSVARPIPATLDDSPLDVRARELNVHGYSPELADIQPWVPHTVKNLRAYLNDNLGKKTIRAAAGATAKFLIVVGEGVEALAKARALGWTIGKQVDKKEGFHRVLEATDPSGRKGFVVQRVNGDDRVLHIQSLLKLAGVPEANVHTVGGTHSWREDYRKTFKSMGYVPDLVVYGFSNTLIDSTLLRNAFKNGRHFATLTRNYKKKLSAIAGEGRSDLDGMTMQVLELVDGRRIWFMHCMFGDLARDLVGAVADHGVKNITFIGSAGSLDPDTIFGSMITPTIYRHADGSEESLGLPEIPGIPHRGRYLKVPTPNVGTRAWTAQTRASGVDMVESELGHVVEEIRLHPNVRLRVALVISEVASGPNHRDMTEWGLSDLRGLFPDLNRVMDASLDASGNSVYVVKSYKSVPLLSPGK